MKHRFYILLFLLLTTCFVAPAIGSANTAVAANMEVVEGLVLVEAKVNGKKGHFILDTGSPALVLNSRYFQGEKSKVIARGLHGQVQNLAEVSVDRFDWMSIQRKSILALALNMSGLERKTNRPILGLIGYELLRDYELLIDYRNQRIELVPVDQIATSGDRVLAKLPFYMRGHLPVIKVKMGDYELLLGLDSGAQSNLLDNELLGLFPEELLLTEKLTKIAGLEQQVRLVPEREVAQFSLGSAQIKKQFFTFVSLKTLSQHQKSPIDGLLGSPFLSKAKVSINYTEGTLTFFE